MIDHDTKMFMMTVAFTLSVGALFGWGMREATMLPRTDQIKPVYVAATCLSWHDSKDQPHLVLSISNEPTSTLTLLRTRDGDYYVPRDNYKLDVINCLGD